MAEDRQDRTDLAAERTEFAEDRTIMAAERTFAGWLRTAFAAIGIGLGFRAVFGEFDPPWLPRAIATLFIVAGALVAVAAQRRACHTMERLESHQFSAASAPRFRLLAWAVVLGAAVLVAGLWVLNDDQIASV